MPVLKVKPHKLEVLSVTNGYEDANGDWHEGQEQWSVYKRCDAVPSGSAETITLPDGTQCHYSYTIYLDKDSREFKTGEKVRISFFGNGTKDEKKEFAVKGFHSYQHQCKMWV